MSPRRPRLVISYGDPAGVGPEVTVKALARPEIRALADLIVTGDSSVLTNVAKDLHLAPPPQIVHAGDASDVESGQLSAAAGLAAFAAVDTAVQLVRQGKADGLVTAPINKEALRLAGFHWPGHTEMLAELTGATDVRMLLTSGALRVVHVSTHRSLRNAIESVSRERVLVTILLAHEAGKMLGLSSTRIGVAGLNPHAGEGGLFGDEDVREILPAVDDARLAGIDASGPWPADTLFWRASRGEFDLVIAMYHDQGHIPVKLSGIDSGVNVSLGLPILRTSVDHGTAFDIAGKGVARWQSMAAAITVAAEIVSRRA